MPNADAILCHSEFHPLPLRRTKLSTVVVPVFAFAFPGHSHRLQVEQDRHYGSCYIGIVQSRIMQIGSPLSVYTARSGRGNVYITKSHHRQHCLAHSD